LPIHLPKKPRAKTIHSTNVERHIERKLTRRRAHAVETIDWLALWALSLGFSAVVLAALALYGGGDPIGASMILFGTAIIIAMVLWFSTAPDDINSDAD
jgi:hypothetical protein